MSDKITAIRPGMITPDKHAEPDSFLIEGLEELLAQARSGNLRAISYAGVTSERAITTSWFGECDIHDMAAGIGILSHRFHSAADWDNT